MTKKTKGSDYPMMVQKRYPNCMDELGETNACPRDTEYDLKPTYSRTRIGSWGDERTFTVVKEGNNP